MTMRGYYDGKLAGERLRRCYELAGTRVRAYLEAEIEFVRTRLGEGEWVLEVGCGYGRVTGRLGGEGRRVVGIDSARESLVAARREGGGEFVEMDAARLGFATGTFHAVVCVQNGICAFGVHRKDLVREALRVTRAGGRALFSSYAEGFWGERLRWFEDQAKAGLVGTIDRVRTRKGEIVCTDGFRSGTTTPEEFRALGAALGVETEVTEVEGSCVVCEFTASRRA